MLSKKTNLEIKPIFIVAVLLGLILIVLAVWFVIRRSPADTATVNQSDDARVESAAENSAVADTSNVDPKVQEIINKIARHALLPAGDVSVAEVQNADLLREQDPYTFQYAKNGDQMLIHAERIIIYDPIADKIVDIVRVPLDSPELDEGESE